MNSNTVKCKGDWSRKIVPLVIRKWKGTSFVNEEGRDRESFREKKNEQWRRTQERIEQ